MNNMDVPVAETEPEAYAPPKETRPRTKKVSSAVEEVTEAKTSPGLTLAMSGMLSLPFKIIGVSPLLTHNPTSLMASSTGKGVSKGAYVPPTPQDEAEAGCYRTPEGYLAVP